MSTSPVAKVAVQQAQDVAAAVATSASAAAYHRLLLSQVLGCTVSIGSAGQSEQQQAMS
jgi:hypothetical protein